MTNEIVEFKDLVNTEEERFKVDGRALHSALQIRSQYRDWMRRMCEYGFEENVDFIAIA